MTWDVICVGTGLTSLTFATLYQQRHPGRKALLLEKHAIPGGYATEFQRPKTQSGFDCSLHKLSGMTGTGNMRRILDEMGILSDLDLVYHDELFEACSEDGDIKLPIKPENFGSALKSAFPHEHVGIDRFLADVDLYGRNAYFQFQILAGQYEPDMKALRYAHKELRKKTVEEVISEYVSDPRLKEILCAPAVYVGGLPEQLGYNYYLHIVFANLFQGTAYVTGSSQKLSDTLVDRIREGGGEVILRTPVARVLSNDQNVAIGVETQQGERFYADQVIINAAPHFALSQLFDGNAALDPVRDRVRHLKPSLATTTQYLVTDCPPAELGLECTEAMIFSPHMTSA